MESLALRLPAELYALAYFPYHDNHIDKSFVQKMSSFTLSPKMAIWSVQEKYSSTDCGNLVSLRS